MKENNNFKNRTGEKIRSIRKEKGISQSELGEAVNLTADRIQKYENGARNPKPELLQQIATTLNVDVRALTEPNLSNPVNVMYSLFELEELYDLEVVKEDSFYALHFGNNTINDYLKEWYEKKLLIGKNIHEYNDWKRNFSSICNNEHLDIRIALLKNEKQQLLDRIASLKEQLAYEQELLQLKKEKLKQMQQEQRNNNE